MLSFDRFLTPTLVVVVYWLGLAALFIGVIGAIMSTHSPFGSILSIIGAIVALVGGAILWRVICESIILAFKMYDRMTEIRDRLPEA